MPGIESLLVDGEEVLWSGNPQVTRSELRRQAIASFFKRVFAIALFLVTAFSLLYFRAFVLEDSIVDYLLWIGAFVFILISIGIGLFLVSASSPKYHLLEYRYAVTNRRILLLEGEHRQLMLFPGSVIEVDCYSDGDIADVSILIVQGESNDDEAIYHTFSKIKDSKTLMKLITEKFGARFSGEQK